MTTAPMRPTVPALRPFLDSPPASFAGGGGERRRRASGALIADLLPGSVGAGARDDDHRHGQLVQHLRRGRAEEEPPRLGEAARADDGELAGLPARAARRRLRCCRRGRPRPRRRRRRESVCERLREHVVGVGGTGDADDAGVDARGQVDRRRATAAAARHRSRRPARRASSSSASAPGRVPIAAVMRVTPAPDRSGASPRARARPARRTECSSSRRRPCRAGADRAGRRWPRRRRCARRRTRRPRRRGPRRTTRRSARASRGRQHPRTCSAASVSHCLGLLLRGSGRSRRPAG